MTKQHHGFLTYRYAEDAERFCDSTTDEDELAKRALFDRGRAAYTTTQATFEIVDTCEGKPYVRIKNEGLWPWEMFVSKRVADAMRWKFVPEKQYRAKDWIEVGYYAWPEEDIARMENAFSRASDAPDATVAQRAEALVLRSIAVEILERKDEAFALLETVGNEFADSPDTRARAYAAEAIVNQGRLLEQQGRRDAAKVVIDKAILRYRNDPESRVREELAPAMKHRAMWYMEAGQLEDALAMNNDAIAAFDETGVHGTLKVLAQLYRNKAVALGKLGRSDEALEACDALVQMFGAASDDSILRQVAWALGVSAGVLRGRGDIEGAASQWRELVDRFDGSNDPDIMSAVKRATAAITELENNDGGKR